MRGVFAVVGLALLATVGSAQERIDPEEAQRYAKLFVEQAGKITDLAIRLEADPEKPFGLKKDDVGALVIPAKGLSVEAIQKAGKDVTPVGQLWVRHLTVVSKDQPVPNEKLRLVSVTINDRDHSLPLFLLGVRKKGDDTRELVIYAKDKTPLLAVPLQEAQSKQELPIELEGKGEDGRGTLTPNILGKYKAQLPMAKQEQ